MRGTARAGLVVLALVAIACGDRATQGVRKSSASVRAARRAYDGAPPVIPHAPMGAACISCHNQRGIEVGDLGFAPPTPHARTAGLSSTSRCRQCHVFRVTAEVFRENDFVGIRQDLRRGTRQHPLAPPRMAHSPFMRENCVACHSGKAAREQIRTPHPERDRCRQCHVPIETVAEFAR